MINVGDNVRYTIAYIGPYTYSWETQVDNDLHVCDYDEARQKFEELSLKRRLQDDVYLMYVDFYENYCSYPTVIEELLDAFILDADKRLTPFIQSDVKDVCVDDATVTRLKELVKEVKESPDIKCRLEVVVGNKAEAISCLLEASHFIMTRTYDTVYTTCLADQFGIELISGVDKNIVFTTSGYNMVRDFDEEQDYE